MHTLKQEFPCCCILHTKPLANTLYNYGSVYLCSLWRLCSATRPFVCATHAHTLPYQYEYTPCEALHPILSGSLSPRVSVLGWSVCNAWCNIHAPHNNCDHSSKSSFGACEREIIDFDNLSAWRMTFAYAHMAIIHVYNAYTIK